MTRRYRIVANNKTVVVSSADSDKEIEIVENLCKIVSKKLGIDIKVVVENE